MAYPFLGQAPPERDEVSLDLEFARHFGAGITQTASASKAPLFEPEAFAPKSLAKESVPGPLRH